MATVTEQSGTTFTVTLTADERAAVDRRIVREGATAATAAAVLASSLNRDLAAEMRVAARDRERTLAEKYDALPADRRQAVDAMLSGERADEAQGGRARNG